MKGVLYQNQYFCVLKLIAMTKISTFLLLFLALVSTPMLAQDVALVYAEPETGDEIKSKLDLEYNMKLRVNLAIQEGTEYSITYRINGGDAVVAVSGTLPATPRNTDLDVPSFRTSFTQEGEKAVFWMNWQLNVAGDVDRSNDTLTKEITFVKAYANDLRAEIIGLEKKTDSLGDITRLTVKLRNTGRNIFYRGSQVQFYFYVNDTLRWNSGVPFLQTYQGETLDPDLSTVYYFNVRPPKEDTIKNKEYCIHVIWSSARVALDRNAYNSSPCYLDDGTSSIADAPAGLETLRYNNGKIYIQMSENADLSDDVQVNVHALTGQKVFSGRISQHSSQLQAPSLHFGMYLVSLTDSKGRLLSTSRLLVH